MERIETLREWKREEKEYIDVKRAYPIQDDFKVFTRIMALKGIKEAKMTDLDYVQVFSMGPEGLMLKRVEKAPVIKVPVATSSSSEIPPIVRRKWEEHEKAVKKGLEREAYLPLPALAKWYEKWRETAIASGISPDDFDDAFLYLDLSLETPEMEDQLRSYLPTLEKPLSEQEREYKEALKEQALEAAKVVREALEARLISPREVELYRRKPRDIQELTKLREEVSMLKEQLEMVKREEIPKPPAVVKIKFRYPWSMLKIDKEILGPFKKDDILEAPREKVESLVAKGYAFYME